MPCLKAKARLRIVKHRISISISTDEIALIRSKMASMGVQIADLRAALGAHQARVRAALLGLGDERDGTENGS